MVAAISLAARARRRRRDDDDDQAPRKRGLSGLLDAVQGSGGKVVALSQRKLARKIGVVSQARLSGAMRDAAAAGARGRMDAGEIGNSVNARWLTAPVLVRHRGRSSGRS